MQVQAPGAFAPSIRSLPRPQQARISQPQLTLVEPPPDGYNPSTAVVSGKWVAGAVAGLAFGALGIYAGMNQGLGAELAGSLAGACGMGIGLATLGLYKDFPGGFSSHTGDAPMMGLLAGGLLGGVGGTLVGALARNPLAGAALGLVAAGTAGLAAYKLAEGATN